jgi:hypothetical protein
MTKLLWTLGTCMGPMGTYGQKTLFVGDFYNSSTTHVIVEVNFF